MGTSIFAFIIVLGVLIFFHELGHFLVARLFGVGVEKFSLGFGPRIFGKTIGMTDYRVSAFPLGGYVKMVGESPGDEIEPEKIGISFTHKHVAKKMMIVAAGPFFNLLLAMIIFFFIYMFSGLYELKPTIGSVGDGSPAQRQGLEKNDLIVAIDGVPIQTWNDLARIIAGSDGRSLTLSIDRSGTFLDIPVTPELSEAQNFFGEAVDRYVIGIIAGGDVFTREIGFLEAISESTLQTVSITKLTVVSIYKLIQGTLSRETIGGPIMIAQMAGQQAKEGAQNLAFFIALLSINLAVINFLPIPVLDGGHLFFFTIEAIIRRPLNTRMREVAQQIGIFVLLMLMIYVFYNDINRLILS
ncbi:MAG: RIP metalloprotease RseP [Deltaproteobacteria bacterium]|nr:RIP metalloprotease RseP [Deltaproteobacteria bacterium]